MKIWKMIYVAGTLMSEDKWDILFRLKELCSI